MRRVGAVLMFTLAIVVVAGVSGAADRTDGDPTVATDEGLKLAELLKLLPPGGRTIGGPAVFRGEPTSGDGPSVYFARSTPLSLCIAITTLAGKTVTLMEGDEPVGLIVRAGQSISGCRPGVDEIHIACDDQSQEPCVAVYRIDRP